ncbi:CYTH-like domain-containing protein [Amylocarpus encephaloides]|uniref:mRNA-capping enzyme subunit beta n=1 Tax=Amylocarpus encephaloides TaxID=45428 RepID=A0A9P7YJD1_9HELO|nr:CYTH-like domain-containing protein [Amylocarpus encephaloides]
MDLRAIINNNEASERSIPKPTTPISPIQPPLHQVFREYGHPPQPSPGKHPSQDYTSQPGGPYASPSTYQNQNQTQTPFAGRPPPPPPIQAPSQHDLRSPARSYSAQSPYQHTPSTSSATQYPFPPTQTPQSPAQHQYPPSYTQSNLPPELITHHGSLGQQNPVHSQASPAPQTPPIGIPGAPHQYLRHQRSQSSLSASTPTPTSAQSQQQYYNPYPQDSPVSAGAFPPSQQIPQHQKQQSQPGTPLGPPLSQRPSSCHYPQPTSPYQQRGSSTGPFPHLVQTSPAPPALDSIPHQSYTPSPYVFQRTSLSEQRRSQSGREQSLSVSPKTRLPSQPMAELAGSQNAQTGLTKRKMDDRDTRPEDSRPDHQADKRGSINSDQQRVSLSASNSPRQPPKKRRFIDPPIWAQSIRNKPIIPGANRGSPKVNGKQPHIALRQTPGVAKAETNGSQHPSPVASRMPMPDSEPDPAILLAPWEKSLINDKPMTGMTKLISDFLFREVVSRDDFGELSSRGVEIEVEAKLGQLIDRSTNQRYMLPVLSECIVATSPNINFKSSMTLPQHSKLNSFLNLQVQETHPDRPKPRPRVPINYRHRRETDKFYGLPHSMYDILPSPVREHVRPNQGLSVRVTHDLKTGQVLAKIIKTRIADLNIHIPQLPLDCRISVNFEMKFEGDLDLVMNAGFGERRSDRHKDRLSYTQGPYQVDLTQVTHDVVTNNATKTEREHELEIELSTGAIREQGMRASAGEPHCYPTLVEGLLNNVMLLSKTVPHVE